MRKDHPNKPAPLSARTGDLGQNSRLALHLWLSTKHLGPGSNRTLQRFCLCTLPICMHLHHMCSWCPWRPKEGVRSPVTSVPDGFELLCGLWRLQPGPRQDQQMLLTVDLPLHHSQRTESVCALFPTTLTALEQATANENPGAKRLLQRYLASLVHIIKHQLKSSGV